MSWICARKKVCIKLICSLLLKEKGVIFVNEPTDMVDWGSRTVLLRDPEDNLIELFSPLAPEQWSEELIEENKKYE